MAKASGGFLSRLRNLVGGDGKGLKGLEKDLLERTLNAIDSDTEVGSSVDDVIAASERRTVADGDVIVAQGDAEDAVYFLLDGHAVVRRDGQIMSEFRAGEVFGEIAMLTGEPRMATVEADGEVVVMRVPGSVIDDTLRHRLWEYAAERRFMSLRGHPLEDKEARARWWFNARLAEFQPGEWHVSAKWMFLFHGEVVIDGQPIQAPALIAGGAVAVRDGAEARAALLPTMPGSEAT